MSEAKFTNGEWRVEPFVNGNAYEIAHNDDGEVIAEYVYDLPDAHLIAAAPEMYAMLEKIVSPYGREDVSDEQIENLLSKARGEA